LDSVRHSTRAKNRFIKLRNAWAKVNRVLRQATKIQARSARLRAAAVTVARNVARSMGERFDLGARF
jgi:hypothetical protein